MFLTPKPRFLRTWALAGLAWLLLSLTVSLAHLRSTQPYYLFELSGLMTILWLEFCFARMFHTLRKERGRYVRPLLLVAVLPPVFLFFINLTLLW